MHSIPTGTITLLFTDIEGSTRLAVDHPERWQSAQDRHHAILNQVMNANDGFVFQVIGDAFCVAFDTPGNGLCAALAAQHVLQTEDWQGNPVKVRMGLHTGAAQWQEDHYHGYITLARVQRIMSVAYGGQILISNACAELLRADLPAQVSLRDMKEHRLAGLPGLERLWQVLDPDLPHDFPPLRSLNEIPNNLPSRLTSFIGREKEIVQVISKLEKFHLVTLTGSGGIGKTRLMLQVASEMLEKYPGGAWLVELAPVSDPGLVTQAVCKAVDVTPRGGISELDALTVYLHDKTILLVLDNCEHLIDTCAQLAETLLVTCPGLRILASSREALEVDGEISYRVPSLSLPGIKEGFEAIAQSESVKLFVERASAQAPGFELTERNAPVVAQICQRLDGIALAIELAAARVKMLTVDQIAARLDDSFRFLTGGSRTALPRQQTLRATIDWSYNLLTNEERTVLQRLSVFMGGWTLEAAEAVCEVRGLLDLQSRLVDKSLVVVDQEHGSDARYFLLETIRQYAREKLADTGEGEAIRLRHLEYYCSLAQQAEPKFFGFGQMEWLQRIENEFENITAALEWSLQGHVDTGQQLAGAAWRCWSHWGHLKEGLEWLQKLLAANPGEITNARAKVITGAGWISILLSYEDQGLKFMEESLAMFRLTGDLDGMAYPLAILGEYEIFRFNFDRARTLLEESLALYQQVGNRWGIRFILGLFGFLAQFQGELEKARQFHEESLVICREIGDQEGAGWELYNLADLEAEKEELDKAMDLYRQSLEIERRLENKVVEAWILRSMGIRLMQREDYEGCYSVLEEAIEIHRKTGDRSGISAAMRFQGWCARLQGDYARSKTYYLESLEWLKKVENENDKGAWLINAGKLLHVMGSPGDFIRLLESVEHSIPNLSKQLIRFSITEMEQFKEQALAALGEEAYRDALENGQSMSLDEAIMYAVKQLKNA